MALQGVPAGAFPQERMPGGLGVNPFALGHAVGARARNQASLADFLGVLTQQNAAATDLAADAAAKKARADQINTILGRKDVPADALLPIIQQLIPSASGPAISTQGTLNRAQQALQAAQSGGSAISSAAAGGQGLDLDALFGALGITSENITPPNVAAARARQGANLRGTITRNVGGTQFQEQLPPGVALREILASMARTGSTPAFAGVEPPPVPGQAAPTVPPTGGESLDVQPTTPAQTPTDTTPSALDPGAFNIPPTLPKPMRDAVQNTLVEFNDMIAPQLQERGIKITQYTPIPLENGNLRVYIATDAGTDIWMDFNQKGEMIERGRGGPIIRE